MWLGKQVLMYNGTTGLGLPCRGLPTNDADASLTGMILDDLLGFVIELESLYT